jgi:hypothetical protein
MGAWTGRQPLCPRFIHGLGGACRLNSLLSTNPSGSASGVGRRMSWPGAATSCPKDSRRLAGPHSTKTTTSGTHVSEGIYDLQTRLERLAFGRRPEGHNPPPLEAYTTTPTEHGDVVRATDEYIQWFLRAYPAAGGENRLSRAAPRPSVEGVGGEAKSPLSHFKAP